MPQLTRQCRHDERHLFVATNDLHSGLHPPFRPPRRTGSGNSTGRVQPLMASWLRANGIGQALFELTGISSRAIVPLAYLRFFIDRIAPFVDFGAALLTCSPSPVALAFILRTAKARKRRIAFGARSFAKIYAPSTFPSKSVTNDEEKEWA